MEPKFILNREKISDADIEKNKNFDELLTKFKNQSIQKARNDRSWWRKKSIRYSAAILGAVVVCTVTLSQLYQSNSNLKKTNALTSTSTNKKESAKPLADKKQRSVTPLNPHWDVAYSRYKVNAGKGASLVHASRSKIQVPKNAFVTKAGQIIEGEVEILYREIHKVSEQLMSGIPMQYDSAGTTYDFESAGMFDIKGEKNGEPVFLSSKATLTVQLASEREGAQFNQYLWDSVAGNWRYLQKDILNPLKPETHTAQQRVAASALSKADVEKQVNEVEVEGKKKIEQQYAQQVAKLPVVKQPVKPRKISNRQNFTLEVDKNEFPELSGFNNVMFEVGDENKNYSDKYTEVTWNDVQVSDGPQKGINYLLSLRKGNQLLELIVYPCLNNVDFEKANSAFKAKMVDYEKALAERKAKEEKLRADMLARQKEYETEMKRNKEERLKNYIREMKAMEAANANEVASLSGAAKVLRVFQISQFGTYNSDGPRLRTGDYKPSVAYQLNSKPFQPNQVYVMDYKDRMFYLYSYKEVSDLIFKKGVRYAVCVPVNGQLYVKQLFNDDPEVIAKKSKLMLDLKALPSDVETIEDVKRYFEI